jgi:hypothetical protein
MWRHQKPNINATILILNDLILLHHAPRYPKPRFRALNLFSEREFLYEWMPINPSPMQTLVLSTPRACAWELEGVGTNQQELCHVFPSEPTRNVKWQKAVVDNEVRLKPHTDHLGKHIESLRLARTTIISTVVETTRKLVRIVQPTTEAQKQNTQINVEKTQTRPKRPNLSTPRAKATPHQAHPAPQNMTGIAAWKPRSNHQLHSPRQRCSFHR